MAKKKYRVNNKKQVTNNRKFKCLDCGQQFQGYEWLVKHSLKYHKDEHNGENIHKYLYDKRNPGDHLCTMCKKEQCLWNDEKIRYDRFCGNPECKKRARELFRKNMKRVYGKDTLLKDPEHQAKMLANRSITKMYTMTDGTEIQCVGSYELDFIEYCDKTLKLTGTDIVETPPALYITYYDNITKVNRNYLPDFYMPLLNLIIEIKDGSKYPVESKLKNVMKENAVMKLNKFHYIKIVDKQYEDFNNLIKELANIDVAVVKKEKDHIFVIPSADYAL